MQAAMAKRKKHSRAEMATKLVQANELATQGKLQSEIARILGVSVMTLHRWRKAPPGPQRALVVTREAREPDRTRGAGDLIAELQLENSRLRQLVTDLLLGKVKLEEAAQSQARACVYPAIRDGWRGSALARQIERVESPSRCRGCTLVFPGLRQRARCS